ncbi:MAG: SDR family oxidoreductase [Congregibacter sp.]
MVTPKTVLVVGASRGIGAAVAEHFVNAGYRVFSVARSPVQAGEWIEADVSESAGLAKIAARLSGISLDALLYMGGTWEESAFTGDYDFLASNYEETHRVIAVNQIAPIELTRLLVSNMRRAANPRAVYIGALSGFELNATREVANTASEFGLRGAVQALHHALKGQGIGFSLINPGNVDTEEVLEDIRSGRFDMQTPIPMSDLISAIEWVLSLSPHVDASDINLLQR